MREKRDFANRTRVLASDEPRKKYFLVYEGKDTEQIYFNAVNDHRDELGINPLIELVPVVRSYSEESWSNPKKILDRVLQTLKEGEKRTATYEMLLNKIMDYFYEEGILTHSRVQAANVWATLRWFCMEHLQASLSDTVANLEDDCVKLIRYFAEESNIESIVEDVPKIIQTQSITYAEGLDKICFIIDRDRGSFVATPENNQYEYVLDKCRENGFAFCLSNPCFEFWLLLHFDEVVNLDQDMLLENPKVTAKRRYAEHELRKLLPGYTKTGYRVETLMARVDCAVANAKKFCEDDEKLEHSLGSKMGLLIEEMRS